MAGGSSDWDALINHQSSLLTETKNLVGNTRDLLDEAKDQSIQNRRILILAVLTLFVSVAAMLITIIKS